MTLVDFPNFNTFLEEDILKGGYSYLSVTQPISGDYLKEFVQGLMEQQKKITQKTVNRKI